MGKKQYFKRAIKSKHAFLHQITSAHFASKDPGIALNLEYSISGLHMHASCNP